MFGLKNISRRSPLTEDEIWGDFYLRIRAVLFINVSVTTYVFCESLIIRYLGLYIDNFSTGLPLAIIFYCTLSLFFILNEYNYRKRRFTPQIHFYSIGVSLYLANVAAITLLVHLTGGASSIYPFLFVFLAMIGSFIAPQKFVAPLAGLGMISHAVVLWLETTGAIRTYPPGVFALAGGLSKEVSSIVVFGLFTIVTLIALFFGQWLFRIFESQREQLVMARSNLEKEVQLRTGDLTDAMEQLQKTYQSLDLEKQRQERFFAHVTHQFRTPIHIINNFVSNFFNGVYGSITPRQVEALNHLALCSQNLLNLINNLLDMSKIESGKMVYGAQRQPLRDQMKKITDFLKPITATKNIPINVAIAPEVPEVLETDWIKLEAIVTNLLHNAIKFSRETPVNLNVRKNEDGSELIFAIEDFGAGVPAEVQDRIFEAFEQHKPSPEFRGSGLGLYISRTFADILGGNLKYRNKEGAGAIFELRLPIPVELQPRNGQYGEGKV